MATISELTNAADNRLAYCQGLSPYAILSSIHTHFYAHHRTCRQWFLSIDIRRRGYVLNNEILDQLNLIGTHPVVVESEQLRRLLDQFPRAVPGRFDYDEFSRFLTQYLPSTAPEPSATKHSLSCERIESSATAAVR